MRSLATSSAANPGRSIKLLCVETGLLAWKAGAAGARRIYELLFQGLGKGRAASSAAEYSKCKLIDSQQHLYLFELGLYIGIS